MLPAPRGMTADVSFWDLADIIGRPLICACGPELASRTLPGAAAVVSGVVRRRSLTTLGFKSPCVAYLRNEGWSFGCAQPNPSLS